MNPPIITRRPPGADQRLAYGTGPLRFGDLRLPAGTGPWPLVVAIHGGYWRNRYDLAYLGHLCAALTAAGMATWNLEYRRVGDAGGGWPGTFHDVAAGVRWIVEQGPALGVDSSRVVLVGHSAGGQLASWLGSVAAVPDSSVIWAPPVSVRGVVSLAGVLDLDEAWQRHLSNDAVVELLGGGPQTVPERYAQASPLALLPVGTPHILIHGEQDDAVPPMLSEAYQRQAVATGTPSTLQLVAGADHFDVVDPSAAAWPVVRNAIASLVWAD